MARDKERDREGDGMRRGRILQSSYLGHREEPGVGGMLEICHFSRGHISTVWTVLCNSSVSDQFYQSCDQN